MLCLSMLIVMMSISAFAYTSTSPTVYKPWYGTVTASNGIYVRSTASTSGTAVASLSYNDAIQITGISSSDSSWYRVQYTTGGKTGYIYSANVSTKNTYCAVNTEAGLYMRSSAGSGSNVILVPYGTSVPYNQTATVSGVTWYHCVWGTTTGWMSGSYLIV